MNDSTKKYPENSLPLSHSEQLVWDVMEEIAPMSQLLDKKIRKKDLALACIAYEIKSAGVKNGGNLFKNFYCVCVAYNFDPRYLSQLLKEEDFPTLLKLDDPIAFFSHVIAPNQDIQKG